MVGLKLTLNGLRSYDKLDLKCKKIVLQTEL